MTGGGPLGLFEAFGVEMEYMIVERDSLSVVPYADELLREAAGSEEFVQDVERGPIAWSNELVCHVVELKTNGPAPALEGLDRDFHADVVDINRRLAARGAMLLTASSTAAATAGPTCRAPISTCPSATMSSSAGCMPRSGSFCR